MPPRNVQHTHPPSTHAGLCPPGAKSTAAAHGVANKHHAAERPAAASPNRAQMYPHAGSPPSRQNPVKARGGALPGGASRAWQPHRRCPKGGVTDRCTDSACGAPPPCRPHAQPPAPQLQPLQKLCGRRRGPASPWLAAGREASTRSALLFASRGLTASSRARSFDEWLRVSGLKPE